MSGGGIQDVDVGWREKEILYETGEHVKEVKEQKTRYQVKSIRTHCTDNQITEDSIAKDSTDSGPEVSPELLIFRCQCSKCGLNPLYGQPCRAKEHIAH